MLASRVKLGMQAPKLGGHAPNPSTVPARAVMAERRLIDCGGVIDGLLGWEKGKVSASNQGSAASSATFWMRDSIHQERFCDSSDRSARKPAIDGCVRVPMCAYMPAALLLTI